MSDINKIPIDDLYTIQIINLRANSTDLFVTTYLDIKNEEKRYVISKHALNELILN